LNDLKGASNYATACIAVPAEGGAAVHCGSLGRHS
jgi:hypothetical protein